MRGFLRDPPMVPTYYNFAWIPHTFEGSDPSWPTPYFAHWCSPCRSVMDHSRALRASVAPWPRDWKRRAGRTRHTWLRTVESDLAPLNIGLATAYHRAQNRQAWSKLVGTATSASGQATRWWWWLIIKVSFTKYIHCNIMWHTEINSHKLLLSTFFTFSHLPVVKYFLLYLYRCVVVVEGIC